ncbi:MAG: hypothetical protein HC906_03340 [Bacteroidales bacterium]|nr:hypothetical protein [Bacteroidales bacterium]
MLSPVHYRNLRIQPVRLDCQGREGNYIEETTAGEEAILNPNGGAIALLTTTRLVYSDSNNRLNENFYKYVFKQDDKGKRYRLGDMVKRTKIATLGDNALNFTLLGDPALALAILSNM